MRPPIHDRSSDALSRWSFAHWRGSVALVGFATIGLASACNDATDEQELESAVATHCTFNSDCASPNICVFGLCHAECETSTDCTSPERCVLGSDGQSNVCQLPAETACQTSASCPGTQVCGVDGNCRDGCTSEADCVSGQVCTQGTCADKTEVAKLGGKLPEATGHTGSGQACTYNSDCKTGLACIDHQCLVQCMVDADCAEGLSCQSNLCVAPECDHDSDCGFGNVCEKNACVAGCRNDAGCDSGSICNSEVCSPGCRNDLGCATGSLCISGVCEAGCTSDNGCDSGSICSSGLCTAGCRTDSDCGSEMRCFALTCESPLFSANNPANGIAATDQHLFVLYGDDMVECPLTGCTAANLTVAATFATPFYSMPESYTGQVSQSPLEPFVRDAIASSFAPRQTSLQVQSIWSSGRRRDLRATSPRLPKQVRGLLTYSQGNDELIPLAAEGAYLFIGTEYGEGSQNVEEGCVESGTTCVGLGTDQDGFTSNYNNLDGTPVSAALRTVSPLSADTSLVYSVLYDPAFEDNVLVDFAINDTQPEGQLPNGEEFALGNASGDPQTMAVIPGATIADDEVAVGFDSGIINAYQSSNCIDSSCAVTIATVTDAQSNPLSIASLTWSASDNRLYWVGQSFANGDAETTTVMRCTPDFTKADSCTPETVLVVSGNTFKGPPNSPFDNILAIANGTLLIADDGNVWSTPLPK